MFCMESARSNNINSQFAFNNGRNLHFQCTLCTRLPSVFEGISYFALRAGSARSKSGFAFIESKQPFFPQI